MKAKVFVQFLLLLALVAYGPLVKGQYCTPTFVNQNTYNCGMQSVTMGYMVNNSGALVYTQPYTDYSSQLYTAHAPGATANFSILVGNGNPTRIAIYVDWNQDNAFAQSEKMIESASIAASTTYAGSFVVPVSQTAGTYRMRITGDLGSQGATNSCALQYTGEVEDYTFIVLGNSLDVRGVSSINSLSVGNNQVSLTFANFTAATNLTSVDIGYNINDGTPVTQTIGSLSLAPGAEISRNFSTSLNISTPGIYTLKVWARNPNGNGSGNASNDTIRKVIQACYPLNGTYTIDPNGSGGSNYTSFTAAVQDLKICGIGGPVTFQVAAGTFTEQITIPFISGVSSANTVSFIGAGKTSTILTFGAQSATDKHTLRFDNAAYINMSNMTVRSTNGTNGWTVHYMGASATFIKLKHINIECAGGGTNATGTGFIPVVFSNSTSSYTTSILAYENAIDSCLIDGGYIGVAFYGNTTTNANYGNYFRYNTVQNMYYYGFYMNYLSEIKIIGNTITTRSSGSTTTASFGMYIINSNNNYPLLHNVSNNKIYNCGNYGIYFSSTSGSTGSRGIISNNFIGGDFRNTTTAYGIHLNSSFWWNIYNNSFNINTNTTGEAVALYVNNGTNQFNIDARNNMMQITGVNGIPYAVYSVTPTAFSDLDYNNYFVKNGANLIFLGTNHTVANFKGGSGLNANSYSIESSYQSSTNLRYANGCITGIQLSQVTKDIDGDSRTTTPNIGADEFINASTNDIGVLSILSPSGQVTPGLQDLKVRLKNFGTNTITSAQVSFTLNNGTPTTISWSGTLLPCGEVDVTFAGSNGVTIASGVNTIRAYSTLPNGNADNFSGNDATTTRVCPAMSGNFTINPSSNAAGNFKTFAEAADALMCSGLNGPVTFTVAAGTYVEQVSISNVAGSSSTNTITFDGGTGNAATRILTFGNSQNATRHTLLLENMKFVTLKNLSILNQSGSYGWSLHILGNLSENISVLDCRVGLTGAAAASQGANYAAIVVNNSTTSVSVNATFKNIVIDNCQILKGYYGVWFYGNGAANTGCKVTNCYFDDVWYYGVYFYLMNAVDFNNNTMKMRLGNVNGNAIYFSSVNATGSSFIRINNNNLYNSGRYGIYMASTNNNQSTNRGEIINNMIGGGVTNASYQGMYMASCNNWNIYHNSISVDFLISTTTGGPFYANGSNQLDIRNNIFALMNPSQNNASVFPMYMDASTGLVCNYNNYYKAGTTTNFVRVNGVTYTAANYVGGGGFNTNSYFILPQFKSAIDLHVISGCMTGPQLAAVPADYDGNTRQSNTTLGADEGNLLDASIGALTAPAGTVINGTQDISYVVTNSGKTTITAFTANYTINGGGQVTQNWTGTLAPCGQVSILFTGGQAATIPSSGVVTIAGFISNVNGGNDNNQTNDSTARGYCNGPLSGNYTLNIGSAANRNFTDIASVMNVLNSCGMNGDVTFKVGVGTFTGQMLIDPNVIAGLNTYKLTFEGVDSAKSVITFNGGVYTLRLNGADNVTFRKMGIHNTGNASAFTVHLTNAANNNMFENCHITSPSVSNTTVITFGIMGAAYTTTGSIWGQFNTVQNSRLEGGYWTVDMYGSGSTTLLADGNKFLNNQILNGYNTGVYTYFGMNTEFTGNTIICPSTASYVMYFSYCPSIKVNRNYIYGAGTYGIYMNQCSPNATFSQGSVSNNMIGGQYTTGQSIGIYNINTFNMDFFHNTILTSTLNTTGYGFYNSSGSGNKLVNNIFVNEGITGTPMYLNTQNTFSRIDFNNLYSTSANLAYTWGTTFFDIASLKASNTTFNVKSVSVKPNLINTSILEPNLHLTTTVAAPSGDNTLGVNVDIDNDPRCTVSKTIGADESNYADAVSTRFTVSDTVYINSPFTAFNADLPGSLRSYAWDFGNDGSIEATTFNATYAFTSSGQKQIKLKSSSCNGADSMIRSVVVVSPTNASQSDFISDKYVVAPFETVTLQDLSTNGPIAWTWSITPDPNSLIFYDPFAQNPEVLFAEPGVYDVCLIADNGIGTPQQKCKTAYITVKDVNSMCIGNLSSVAVSGEIYDSGGPAASYGNNENCNFLIEPCASSINLKFTQFAAANAAHYLRVYDGRDITGTLLGTFSNTSGLPGGTNGLTATSGAMFITWNTSATGTAAGFAATWTSVPNTSNTLVAGFEVPDNAFILETVNFTNTSVGTGMTYSWDVDSDGIEDAQSADVVFVYTIDGTYYPKLVVTDACGNSQTVIDTLVIVTPTNPPAADFFADARVVEVGDTVRITDLSTNGPINWFYDISPTTFTVVGGTAKNPLVIFTDTGWYSITLDADNAAGTGSITKTNYIRVLDYCTVDVSALVPDIGINRVKFNTLENSSGSGVQGFTSYFNNPSVGAAIVDAGGNYEIQISRTTTLNKMNRKVWIDYNADGDFSDAGELVGSEAAALTALWSFNLTIPTTAARGTTRMRVGTAFADSTNGACGTNFFGEVEEYRVVINDDITAPIITRIGGSPQYIGLGQTYADSGATAVDAVDGILTASIVTTNNLTANVAGTYYFYYNVTDAAGNAAVEVQRVVIVLPDITPPVLQLASPTVIVLPLLATFNEPGYSATDVISGNVTASVQVDRSAFDSTVVGTYTIRYVAFDAFGNTDTAYRTVHVIDNIAPTITLNGANPMEIEVNTPFNDPGVSVSDNYDPIVTAVISGNVNINTLGTYTIQYEAKDASGNISSTSRIVNVVDKTVPVLMVANTDTIVVEVFGNLALPALSATDNYDNNPQIVVGGTYDLDVLGVYTLNIHAVDGSGNQSPVQNIVIKVIDSEAPVMTLNGSYLINVMRWATFTDPGVSIIDNYDVSLVPTKGGNFVNTAEEGLYYITYDVTDLSGNVAAQVIRAVNVVASLTSLGETEGSKLNLYPNPAVNAVTLTFAEVTDTDMEVRIISNLGQLVTTQTWSAGSTSTIIDLTSMVAGVYYVQVIRDGNVSMNKLIIAK